MTIFNMYNYTNNMNFYNDLLKTVLDIIMHKTGMEIDEINQKETCSSKILHTCYTFQQLPANLTDKINGK